MDKEWIHGMKPSDQPQFSTIKGCMYHSIPGEYNNWIIIYFALDISTDEADIEDVYKVLLNSIGLHMTELIKIDLYGAVNTDDPKGDDDDYDARMEQQMRQSSIEYIGS
eukprot:1835200-Ditylum_brightwellii.AAC.1